MKKLISIILTITMLLTLLTFSTATEEIGEITVLLNGEKIEFDQRPIIQNDRTLVPIRFIAERLGAVVTWYPADQAVTIVKGLRLMILEIDNPEATINGSAYPLDQPPIVVNDRTLVPLRFVAEAFDALVRWDGDTQTVVITMPNPSDSPAPSVSPALSPSPSTSPSPSPTSSGSSSGHSSGTSTGTKTPTPPPATTVLTLTVGNVSISIGNTLSEVTAKLGTANRIDDTPFGFVWHVWNSDYSRFFMVGIADDKVVALYSNSKGFALDNVRYGDVNVTHPNSKVTLYFDENNGENLHACMVMPSVGAAFDYTEYIDEMELEFVDVLNAFRANNTLPPVAYDAQLSQAARQHSKYMADTGYFGDGDDGHSPLERYRAAGGIRLDTIGVCVAKGTYSAVDMFAQSISVDSDRTDMLNSSATYVGVGIGVNMDSKYKFFYTQYFGMDAFSE